MIYEERVYATVPGRMPALVKRFKDHTFRIFEKHGMEVVFIGLSEFSENSNNELAYVLRFDSYADMAEKWAGFMSDPEWVEVRAASEVDGAIVAKVSRKVINPGVFG